MNIRASLLSLIEQSPRMGPLILTILEAGLSGSGFAVPLGSSGILLSVNTVTKRGDLTITLHFSESPAVPEVPFE